MAGINKSINICCNKSRSNNSNEIYNSSNNKRFDIIGIVISLSILSADLVIDGVLILEYYKRFKNEIIFLLLFHIVLLITFQILSMKWYLTKHINDKIQWISHCCLFGITYRYISLLQTYIQNIDIKTEITSVIYHSRHEVYKLHILYLLVKSVPQSIFNTCIIINEKIWIPNIASSMFLMSMSIVWILIQYLRSRPIAKETLACGVKSQFIFYLFSNIFMLTGRIALFILLIMCFQFWTLVLIGLHWTSSTVWTFSKSESNGLSLANVLYNIVIGLSNCFVLIDFNNNLEILQILLYYLIVIIENICCITLCFILKTDTLHKLLIILTSLTMSSTIMSAGTIFLYHKYFYNINGKIKFKKKLAFDVENAENNMANSDFEKNSRKSVKRSNCPNDKSESGSKDISDAEITDRKLLLENLVARSGTPTFICTPILDENTSNDILFHSIINDSGLNEEMSNDESITNLKNKLKRRGICSVSDLGLKPVDSDENDIFIEDIDKICDLSVSKRRGICSSVELELYNKIQLDNNINKVDTAVDLQKKRKPIYVTFDNNDIEIISINNVPLDSRFEFVDENCEVESKISDDSKYTLILSAPSEIMSAHDYENVCAVNIAREFWGLRSWRGYSDIETWLHDDSIVRDQDNITSTVATSTSSEISSNDAFENISMNTENMCVLLDNSKPIDMSKINHKRFKSSDCKEDLFNIKPYIIDQNGGFLPAATLSPIKEELEESPEKNESGSTLVTTIDVIRKNTDINSPRYIYHRTENILESPTSNKSIYKPRSLWPTDNITNSLPKSTKPIYENNSIVRNKLIANSKILMNLCDNELKNCDNFTNIMYLDKPIISSSLQSLVSSSSSEDILSISEIARCFPLVKKHTGRPRRKFSLIRDRFEMSLRKQVDFHNDLKKSKYGENDINVPNM